MALISDMQFAVAQFGAANRVVADDTGVGSFYVAVPKMTNAQLFTGGDAAIHPAFIVNGVTKDEILIGKYHAFVKNNRAYSLPGVIPNNYVTFDQCVTYCKNKGNGHHLITNAEYAMLALWTKKNGTMPRGNTSYGVSSDVPSEIGIPGAKDGNGNTWSTKTGSGYPAWYHNGDLSGIDGLCGNLWHWCGGLRLNNGEIQVTQNNNAAMANADFGVSSAQWRAIKPDGSLVAPGTAGTLKWDYTTTPSGGSPNLELDTVINYPQADDNSYWYKPFESLVAKSGVTVPMILKSLALFPAETGYRDDHFWGRNNGERFPLRGGSFFYGAASGVFALNLFDVRALSSDNVGFRVAFCNL